MGVVQVKKVVAVCFLEAVKLALEHLGTYRLEVSQYGIVGSPELPRLYGEARRLRDYLQRCASAYQEIVDLDLADQDRSLLVACCRRLVTSIDMRMTGEQLVPADERQYQTKKRQVIADWTVALASNPLMELPLPKLSPVQTEGCRALTSRLGHKLFGPADSGPIHRHDPLRDSQPLRDSSVAGVPLPTGDYEPAAPLEPVEGPVRPAVAVAAAAPVDVRVLDSQTLRDPRLRALVAMDLRSLTRAQEGEDYRMAAVLLASILESVVLDHAIPRRAELGLPGTPDGWNPLDVLSVALGDKLQPQDRSLAYHLFTSRNLLRPAVQIVTPSVVTVSSFERLQKFVQRVLRALGYVGGADNALPVPPLLQPSTSSAVSPQPPV